MNFKTLAAAASLVFAAAAGATPVVINQASMSTTVVMASTDQQGLAQSFMQTTGDSVGAGVFVAWGGPATLNIGLYDQLPTAGGVLLAQGSAAAVGGSWVDVFWNSVSLAAATPYYLVFSAKGTALSLGGDVTNPYASGKVYANNFDAYSNFDYAFRTFSTGAMAVTATGSTTNLGPGAAVSEPGTVALTGLALFAAAALRRRSRV